MKITKKEKIKRIDQVYSLFYLNKKSIKDIEKELKISRMSVYRYLKIIQNRNSLTKPR